MILMNRRDLRIEVVKVLYEINILNEEIINNKELDKEVKEVVNLVIANKKTIDEKISQNLVNYTINRLNIVDLAIIELATYEMLYTDTPFQIIINEALNISRKYTQTDDYDSVKFNNKLLDQIHKSMVNNE